MKNAQKIDLGLTGYDELFMNEAERKENKLPRIYDIPISEIDDFPDHPFKVKIDEDMDQLVQSIKERGIITPVTLRPKEDGRYEIVSGHRRKKACELAGFETVKAEVREMTRDEAIILMVESNLQRSTILPSEKAFSYKMRLEAMNRQGERTDLTCSPMDNKLKGVKSASLLKEATGDGQAQVYRYIRLTELIPELLDMVDESRIALRPAVELSYLKKEEQSALLEEISYADATPSLAQAIKMKKFSQEGKLSNDVIESIMSEEKPNQKEKINIKYEDARKYIPASVPYTKFNENFWDNYPSNLNNTIEPDTIKLLLGRIMQYGYQGNISTSWRSQDAADADKMAHAAATQLLVWETVVGERDADFNHVSTGGKDTIKSTIGKNNPLYSRINSYYDSMVASVQSHSKIPSFMAKSSGKAKDIELEWTGSEYTATLTDSNGVLSKYTFSANVTGIKFSVSGNKLTITAKDAPADKVSITATKSNTRTGVIVWSDGKHRSGGVQDTVTYSASVSDPVKAFLNIKVSYGSAKIVKTSEDGKVDCIKFTVVGDGVNQTVTTNSKGEIQIDNLKPGVYTVTEQTYDKYVPQETHRVTVLAGQTATVSFNNV